MSSLLILRQPIITARPGSAVYYPLITARPGLIIGPQGVCDLGPIITARPGSAVY
ncbi:hypothetical protein DPMN_094792 [Dreissena polymorpha]|uniref:Uncharacterized protein n=1 Tax=Dreissena polymorpha TaxID=45954 RepID=A0A9D4L6R1_DREPO|nr:hypothetical protein DPMN_094792 [Dreissena polymorpha]